MADNDTDSSIQQVFPKRLCFGPYSKWIKTRVQSSQSSYMGRGDRRLTASSGTVLVPWQRNLKGFWKHQGGSDAFCLRVREDFIEEVPLNRALSCEQDRAEKRRKEEARARVMMAWWGRNPRWLESGWGKVDSRSRNEVYNAYHWRNLVFVLSDGGSPTLPRKNVLSLPQYVKAQKCFWETLPKTLGTNKGFKTGTLTLGNRKHTSSILHTSSSILPQSLFWKEHKGPPEHHKASCEALSLSNLLIYIILGLTKYRPFDLFSFRSVHL